MPAETVPDVQAKDLMSRPLVTAPEGSTLQEIARLMLRKGVGSVVMVDPKGELAGIITESDFMAKDRMVPFSDQELPQVFGHWVDQGRLEHAYAAARQTPAREVMTKQVWTVTETTEIDEVVRLMLRRRVKRLPVLRDKKPVGIVARRDLLRLIADAPKAKTSERAARATGARKALPRRAKS